MAGRHVRVADPMPLPRTRNGQLTRSDIQGSRGDSEGQATRRNTADFDAFVAMPVKPPILMGLGVPETSHAEFLQIILWKSRSWVAAAAECFHAQSAFGHSRFERLAGIGVKQFAIRAEGSDFLHGFQDVSYLQAAGFASNGTEIWQNASIERVHKQSWNENED